MENHETQVTPDQPVASPELTITDLANIRSIIDVAVRRGAFGASEVSAVGSTFDKLSTFLNAVNPPKSDQAPAQ